MRALPLLKLGLVSSVALATSLFHHGHIIMFLARVRDLLPRHLRGALKRYDLEERPSALQLSFGDPAASYKVAVQRKQRAIEIGLYLDAGREANQRWMQALGEHDVAIRAQLGPGVELEQWTKDAVRLHESRPVAGPDWSPKRDLTEALANEIAERLARYVEVLQPLLAGKRTPVRRAPAQAPRARRGAGGRDRRR